MVHARKKYSVFVVFILVEVIFLYEFIIIIVVTKFVPWKGCGEWGEGTLDNKIVFLGYT